MRSLKENRSLLIEGIDGRAFEALAWTATDLSFVDLKTGRVERFLVGPPISHDARSLRLPMLD
jgi:hypothetical protein